MTGRYVSWNVRQNVQCRDIRWRATNGAGLGISDSKLNSYRVIVWQGDACIYICPVSFSANPWACMMNTYGHSFQFEDGGAFHIRERRFGIDGIVQSRSDWIWI
jgi:hypothetical protein